MIRSFSFLVLLLAAGPAAAHTGVTSTSDFVAGFLHPIGGLDHLLAMIAVGLWAGQRQGAALWAMPLAFLGGMAGGGLLGSGGVGLPFVEIGIALSVVLIGVAAALDLRRGLPAALAALAVSGALHGHAHGAEMPADVAGLTYATGFLVATAALHGLGLGLGATARRFARLGGAVAALGGAALLLGA